MKTLVSAHNCIFGPRYLGIYGSSLRHWKDLQAKYDCFFVVDDLIGHFVQPVDANTYADKAQVVAANFLSAGVDPAKANIVLVSEVPEIYELAVLLSSTLNLSALASMLDETVHAQMRVAARKRLGLETAPTVTEAFYPYVFISSYTLGLGADIWQGGAEVKVNWQAMNTLAKRFNRRAGKTVLKMPTMLIGEPASLPGFDGNHMIYTNRLDLNAPISEIERQVRSIKNSSVAAGWFNALGMKAQAVEVGKNKKVTPDTKARLTAALVSSLAPFRESRITNRDVLEAFARGTSAARTRVSTVLGKVKDALGIGSYLAAAQRTESAAEQAARAG